MMEDTTPSKPLKDNNQIKNGTSPHERRDSVGSVGSVGSKLYFPPLQAGVFSMFNNGCASCGTTFTPTWQD